LRRKVAKADKAFRTWAALPFSERSKIIGRSPQVLLEKKEELARLATLEMGKRIVESRGEVELSASIMQYFADRAQGFLAPKKLDSAVGDARIEYSPFGVLLSVQPWNYPYYQPGSLCRSPSDVWQCDAPQARAWRSPVCIGL
jgi:succinate-semialdehyde dehydrogenase/glutarate-semialdehyde dehydrogenase